MTSSCVAYGCTMRSKTNLLSQVTFHRFPKDPERRIRWIKAVRRKEWHPTENSRLCSLHFVSGKPSKDKDNIDWVPSIFCFEPQKVSRSFQYAIVKSVVTSAENFQCELRVNISSGSEFFKWLAEFEGLTNTGWIVRTARKCDKRSKFIFSRNYVCHFSSYGKTKKIKDEDTGKNKRCGASLLVRIKKNSKYCRRRDMFVKWGLRTRIKIDFAHSHSLSEAENGNWLRKSEETKSRFMQYFTDGMTPAVAILYHKTLYASTGRQELVHDSRVSPAQSWVYRLHKKWMHEKLHREMEIEDKKQLEENESASEGEDIGEETANVETSESSVSQSNVQSTSEPEKESVSNMAEEPKSGESHLHVRHFLADLVGSGENSTKSDTAKVNVNEDESNKLQNGSSVPVKVRRPRRKLNSTEARTSLRLKEKAFRNQPAEVNLSSLTPKCEIKEDPEEMPPENNGLQANQQDQGNENNGLQANQQDQGNQSQSKGASKQSGIEVRYRELQQSFSQMRAVVQKVTDENSKLYQDLQKASREAEYYRALNTGLQELLLRNYGIRTATRCTISGQPIITAITPNPGAFQTNNGQAIIRTIPASSGTSFVTGQGASVLQQTMPVNNPVTLVTNPSVYGGQLNQSIILAPLNQLQMVKLAPQQTQAKADSNPKPAVVDDISNKPTAEALSAKDDESSTTLTASRPNSPMMESQDMFIKVECDSVNGDQLEECNDFMWETDEPPTKRGKTDNENAPDSDDGDDKEDDTLLRTRDSSVDDDASGSNSTNV